jgi:hypothetical protein
MQQTKISSKQIIREKRNISKYAGLRYSRFFLVICLFFLSVPLRPTSIYLFAFFFLVPWIVSTILADKIANVPVFLESCARKYHYTSLHFSVERCIGRIAVLFLVAWQLSLSRSSVSSYLLFAPGILLLFYLLCRIVSTAIIRQQIHHYYTDFTWLENNK